MDVAGNIVFYLKQGNIDITTSEYLQFMILKLYNSFCYKKRENFFEWFEGSVGKMIDNGMFYYAGGNIQNYMLVMKLIVKENKMKSFLKYRVLF
ncbi:MAG: hypothetical protein K2L07_16635 [Lachnospiraceae bacterium]|nr:hypothetical protein [Lachnospiraceae bacterium]